MSRFYTATKCAVASVVDGDQVLCSCQSTTGGDRSAVKGGPTGTHNTQQCVYLECLRERSTDIRDHRGSAATATHFWPIQAVAHRIPGRVKPQQAPLHRLGAVKCKSRFFGSEPEVYVCSKFPNVVQIDVCTCMHIYMYVLVDNKSSLGQRKEAVSLYLRFETEPGTEYSPPRQRSKGCHGLWCTPMLRRRRSLSPSSSFDQRYGTKSYVNWIQLWIQEAASSDLSHTVI